MPTYDYRCERTGEMFELWQSFADDALTTCPQVHEGEPDECGAGVRKVFSKVGIAFKGDGFYKNDHGSTAKSRPSETSSSSSSGECCSRMRNPAGMPARAASASAASR